MNQDAVVFCTIIGLALAFALGAFAVKHSEKKKQEIEEMLCKK